MAAFFIILRNLGFRLKRPVFVVFTQKYLYLAPSYTPLILTLALTFGKKSVNIRKYLISAAFKLL